MLIHTYYKKIAKEYETIYRIRGSAGKEELGLIEAAIESLLKNRAVLEVAAGTGFWTSLLSTTAARITATDIEPDILAIARLKKYYCPVTFAIEDAYALTFADRSFNGGVASFWFSHVPKELIRPFLHELHRVMKRGSRIFIADSVYDKDAEKSLIRKPADANTYVNRQLSDGPVELLKNYYTKEELFDLFRVYDNQFDRNNIFYGNRYWFLHYRI
jgi:ubiquinone/menaquinone biosynthesis C-methylase UbiE